MSSVEIFILAFSLLLIGLVVGVIVGSVIVKKEPRPVGATLDILPLTLPTGSADNLAVRVGKARLAWQLEIARQHQEMADRYQAYGEFREYLRGKIAHLDTHWHEDAIDDPILQQLRGQKRALLDVHQNIEAMHAINIEEQAEKIRQMPDEPTMT